MQEASGSIPTSPYTPHFLPRKRGKYYIPATSAIVKGKTDVRIAGSPDIGPFIANLLFGMFSIKCYNAKLNII